MISRELIIRRLERKSKIVGWKSYVFMFGCFALEGLFNGFEVVCDSLVEIEKDIEVSLEDVRELCQI